MATGGKKLNLLSLDGGGIRGLSTLYILKQVMTSINPKCPPKPCEYFDVVAGTSTGGLIAIMLGRLKMDVDECINAYNRLSSKAFSRKAFLPCTLTGKVHERFDSKQLELALKQTVMDRGYNKGALLKNPDTSCRVFLCAIREITCTTIPLRSYLNVRDSSGLYDIATIWETGRATSAASTYFDPISIGPDGLRFFDGTTGANNPIYHLLAEAKDVWSSQPLEHQLGCIVSIGTNGAPTAAKQKLKGIRAIKAIKQKGTDTEKTEVSFAEQHPHLVKNNQYFRFNVPCGLGDVGLKKVSKIDHIADMTQHHLAKKDVQGQVQMCAKMLCKDRVHSLPSGHSSAKKSQWGPTGPPQAQSCAGMGSNSSNSCAASERVQFQSTPRKRKLFGLFASKKSVAI